MLRLTAPAAVLALAALVAVADTTPGPRSLAELYKSGALFDARQYRAVRAAFAAEFEKKHADTIKEAFGDRHAALSGWLDKHPDVKQELFTAIDEAHDDVAAALRLFAELWSAWPDKVAAYPSLAIATAVVWDRPDRSRTSQGGVYDYRHHQARTKSTLPESLIDGKGNFEYLVTAPANVTANLKTLPREFLMFVVDHKTPIDERKWAQKYVAKARGVSSWHQDVPYDKGMLATERTGKGPGPKLAGKAYTLENIKKFGGVCAQQADFVARVGKSVGQPAVYVSGESSYRGWHAWVMWVTVLRPSRGKDEKDSVKFALVSDGRTRGFEKDAYYVGHLTDPQSGQRILDRDMERRLGVVALGARVRRQSAMAMRAYPALAEELKFEPKQRLAYLERVWALSPYSEEAWMELANLAKTGELPKAAVSAKLATLLKTFARWPDFIARVTKEVAPSEPAAARAKHLAAAAALFEKAHRPDLACDAQLAVAEALREQKKHKEASAALRLAVKKFPTEGRYIPRLMAACEQICDDYPASAKLVADLYVQLVPALTRYYKGEQSKPLEQLRQQAYGFFMAKNLMKHAAKLRALVGGG